MLTSVASSLGLYVTSADEKLKYPNLLDLTVTTWVTLVWGAILSISAVNDPPTTLKTSGWKPLSTSLTSTAGAVPMLCSVYFRRISIFSTKYLFRCCLDTSSLATAASSSAVTAAVMMRSKDSNFAAILFEINENWLWNRLVLKSTQIYVWKLVVKGDYWRKYLL